MSWEMQRNDGRIGTGHWKFWDVDIGRIESIAADWKKRVAGAEKLWLCWNINDRWCELQQKLILEIGWTPVVGWDPASAKCPERVVPGAIVIDFNENLNLPTLYPHIPLEFAFLWADRLATWHSDILLSRKKMKVAAERFNRLESGGTIAVRSFGGWKNLLNRRNHRYWEVLACTTGLASMNQYKCGAGWWRGIEHHPSVMGDSIEQVRRRSFYDDHGCGIEYWRRFYNGNVASINESWIAKEHFSVISVKNYVKCDSKWEEMERNFNLDEIANRLGVGDLLSKK